MNKQIDTMIKLQRFNDSISRGKSKIEKSIQVIDEKKADIEERKDLIESIESDIRNKKSSIKQKEIDLTVLEDQCAKLEERKMVVTKEKELQAIGNELEKAITAKSEVEDELIYSFDDLEALESKLEKSRSDLQKDEEAILDIIKEHTERIARIEKLIQENQSSFDALFPELEPGISVKFKKLIGSGNGVAIASVDDEICGNCRFKIPGSLSLEAGKDDKIVTCENCGKYIYRIV